MIDYYLTPEDYRIAEKNGISQQTAYRRFYQLNWSRKRTIHTPPRKMNKYGKWHDIAKQNGIKANAFMNRIYRGWDVERAATTPLNK